MLKLKNNNSGFPGLILFLLFIQLSNHAQEINTASLSGYDDHFHKVIGLDENLINGYQYNNLYPNITGHAFFGKDEFVPGLLVLNNKRYTDIKLKFDILNQDLVLSYVNSFGGMSQIVLQKSLITEFQINDKHFEKLDFTETGSQFFQVICNNKIQCLYLWEKTLQITTGSLKSYYEYSEQSKKTYLVLNNSIKRYRGNTSFVKLFPEAQQGQIKKYIRTHKIKIKEASDASIKKLIEFCEDLKYEGIKA